MLPKDTHIEADRHGRSGHPWGLGGEDDVGQDAVFIHDLMDHVTRGHLHGHGQGGPIVGDHPHSGWTYEREIRRQRVSANEIDTTRGNITHNTQQPKLANQSR